MKQQNIQIPRDQIADFCRRNHIRKLALFGSVLRDDFRQDSDIDVLVEFDPAHIPGFDFFCHGRGAIGDFRQKDRVEHAKFLKPIFS